MQFGVQTNNSSISKGTAFGLLCEGLKGVCKMVCSACSVNIWNHPCSFGTGVPQGTKPLDCSGNPVIKHSDTEMLPVLGKMHNMTECCSFQTLSSLLLEPTRRTGSFLSQGLKVCSYKVFQLRFIVLL
jgi:hypothetical protein